MNRGRRRGGGGPSLSGLRDGVKRRLFDPHSVPTKPDPKQEVNRLVPIVFPKPLIHCRLESKNKSAQDKQLSSSMDHSNLVYLTGVMEYAFSTSPYHHSLPVRSEGIAVGHAGAKGTSMGIQHASQDSLLHLLVARNDINRWGSDGPLKHSLDPDDWYPTELINRIQMDPKKKAIKRMKHQKRRYVADMSELITDRMIQQVTEVIPENDDEIEKPEMDKDDQEAGDSEDDRWNGEINPAENPDDVDDEEFDNDYCQTYFDNGERDFSDDGDDDDDGGGRYFD